jgi:hypothetical protein
MKLLPGCQELENNFGGVGLLAFVKQKWKRKKVRWRKGLGNEEKLVIRPA